MGGVHPDLITYSTQYLKIALSADFQIQSLDISSYTGPQSLDFPNE